VGFLSKIKTQTLDRLKTTATSSAATTVVTKSLSTVGLAGISAGGLKSIMDPKFLGKVDFASLPKPLDTSKMNSLYPGSIDSLDLQKKINPSSLMKSAKSYVQMDSTGPVKVNSSLTTNNDVESHIAGNAESQGADMQFAQRSASSAPPSRPSSMNFIGKDVVS
jgi:hypothetical protein